MKKVCVLLILFGAVPPPVLQLVRTRCPNVLMQTFATLSHKQCDVWFMASSMLETHWSHTVFIDLVVRSSLNHYKRVLLLFFQSGLIGSFQSFQSSFPNTANVIDQSTHTYSLKASDWGQQVEM